MTRAGFIGLGSQGSPMAHRILEAGHPLSIWARRPETIDPFADTLAHVVESPAEVARCSELVGICVVDDAGVEDVVLRGDGVLAGMGEGGIIAVHSTVHPDTCRRLADRAAPRNVHVIDAPVSGGAPAAQRGQLVVMVGGEDAIVEQARPVLQAYGDPILHLGPIGSGQIAKLLNNLAFTAQLAIGFELFHFAEELGLDPSVVAKVLAQGSGGSRGLDLVAGSGFRAQNLAPLVASLLAKDVGIMSDVAQGIGVVEPSHVAKAARAALRMFESQNVAIEDDDR